MIQTQGNCATAKLELLFFIFLDPVWTIWLFLTEWGNVFYSSTEVIFVWRGGSDWESAPQPGFSYHTWGGGGDWAKAVFPLKVCWVGESRDLNLALASVMVFTFYLSHVGLACCGGGGASLYSRVLHTPSSNGWFIPFAVLRLTPRWSLISTTSCPSCWFPFQKLSWAFQLSETCS